MRILRPLLPLLVLLAVLAPVWFSGVGHDFSWHGLARHQAALTGWVAAHPVIAPLAYVGFYVAVAALCLPEAAVVTVAGGLLFGTLFGGALAVIGATLGSIVLFLVARSALAGSFVRGGGALLARTRAALQRDGFAYLLAIRLIPAFPFWLVNLAAAVGGMRLLPYATATFIGIIPVTMVFSSLGEGLGKVLAQGREPDVLVVFSPSVLLPLLALAALSLVPVLWRHWKARRG
ncbi:MAG TPA: VTT domain-containing protein [Acetobacteraceae bacterium]|nr:VTT domain-containing protein [Acetobacteraceae bacterium]